MTATATKHAYKINARTPAPEFADQMQFAKLTTTTHLATVLKVSLETRSESATK